MNKALEDIRAFNDWAAHETLSSRAKAFLRTVVMMRLAKKNAHRDAERAEHAESFLTIVRVRAGQIIADGC